MSCTGGRCLGETKHTRNLIVNSLTSRNLTRMTVRGKDGDMSSFINEHFGHE